VLRPLGRQETPADVAKPAPNATIEPRRDTVLRSTRTRLIALVAAVGLMGFQPAAETQVTKTDNVTQIAHFPYLGGGEVDFDGDRYLFAGQANLQENLQRGRDVTADDAVGGIHIVDTWTMREVGFLDCPGTDNYVRYLDPEVFSDDPGEGEYIVVAHHGNDCTRDLLEDDPNTRPGYGAWNGIMIVDVTNKRKPKLVGTVGADSAHTVMPHPTEPYVYILPGGLANGTNVPNRSVSPTAIIDVDDPTNPRYVTEFTHNAQGCHDLGFTHDGNYAYCAGFGEVQVWDVSDVENPRVTGTIVNPAIQFAHNAVVSPSGRYLAINDEAFGFHTCTGEAADLYGSLWIYDISIPQVPVLAGRVSPPGHPDDQTFGTLYDAGPVNGWADSWCAAHNYNWVPGNDDVIVASWFAGGVTAHDISDLTNPELVAHYMPHDGVAWSGHYYGGYLVSNDMARGLEILDVPEVRAADDTRYGGPPKPRTPKPRVDRSAELIPTVLPARPVTQRDPQTGAFCVIPARPA
jgi:hypothetical protein